MIFRARRCFLDDYMSQSMGGEESGGDTNSHGVMLSPKITALHRSSL